jgi:hypothetical protein
VSAFGSGAVGAPGATSLQYIRALVVESRAKSEHAERYTAQVVVAHLFRRCQFSGACHINVRSRWVPTEDSFRGNLVALCGFL